MSNNHSKYIIATSLFLVFFLGVIVGLKAKTMSPQTEKDGVQHARRTLRVTIKQSQWDELFIQLQDFADKWRYAVRIAPLDPNGNSYNVEMWRADMRLTAFMDVNFDEGTVQIHFYDTDNDRPNPDSYFDEEIRDLKNLISEIPGATITEEY